MINYYDILNVSPLDEIHNINLAYKQKINRYTYNNLSNNDIEEIKLLKKAKYILTNPNLKYKYDYLLYKSNNIDASPNLEQPNNVSMPLPENDNDNDNDFNSVFNVDNKWMQDNEYINTTNAKQDNKLDNKLINGRIFDLSGIYNRQVNYENMPQLQNTRDDA